MTGDPLRTVTSAESDDPIQSRLRALEAAWNAADADAFAANFTEDCDFVTVDGIRLRGRAAVADSLRNSAEAHHEKMWIESSEVRLLDPTTLLVHTTGATASRYRNEPLKSPRSIQTFVAVRRDGNWLFTAFQNTRIAQVAPTRSILARLLAKIGRAAP